MNLRKIIKEEMDDFDWIRDFNPTVKLEPNTVYYFRPMLTVEEYPLLAKFIDSDELKLKLDERAKLTHMMDGIHYIVYDLHTWDNIRFWENELGEDPIENSATSMKDSKHFYPDYNFIDFRKHYKFFNNINESEEDDLSWIRDINSDVILEPNTMYFFEPKVNYKSLNEFSKRITNSPKIKKLLEKRKEELSYFVTANDVNDLWGWCSGTSPLVGRSEFYNNQVDMVDVRKEFGVI